MPQSLSVFMGKRSCTCQDSQSEVLTESRWTELRVLVLGKIRLDVMPRRSCLRSPGASEIHIPICTVGLPSSHRSPNNLVLWRPVAHTVACS